jgi:hypothetical protein
MGKAVSDEKRPPIKQFRAINVPTVCDLLFGALRATGRTVAGWQLHFRDQVSDFQ